MNKKIFIFAGLLSLCTVDIFATEAKIEDFYFFDIDKNEMLDEGELKKVYLHYFNNLYPKYEPQTADVNEIYKIFLYTYYLKKDLVVPFDSITKNQIKAFNHCYSRSICFNQTYSNITLDKSHYIFFIKNLKK